MKEHTYAKTFGFSYTAAIHVFWKYKWVRSFVEAPGDNRRNPIYKKVKKIVRPVIDTYKGAGNEPVPDTYFQSPRPLWFFWWQGEDAMPEIVRVCYHRMCACIPHDVARVVLVTKDNYKQYYEIPEKILEKQGKGLEAVDIADISRHILLSEYGGVWLDANYYASDTLPKEWFEDTGVFTRRKNYACWPPHFGNWSSSFLGGPPGNVTTRFVRDALLYYWQHYDIRIDYTLQAQLLSIAYEIFADTRCDIDRLPVHDRPLFLDEILNEPYEEKKFLEVLHSAEVHKLPYRITYEKMTADGKLTVYGYLIETDKDYGTT